MVHSIKYTFYSAAVLSFPVTATAGMRTRVYHSTTTQLNLSRFCH